MDTVKLSVSVTTSTDGSPAQPSPPPPPQSPCVREESCPGCRPRRDPWGQRGRARQLCAGHLLSSGNGPCPACEEEGCCRGYLGPAGRQRDSFLSALRYWGSDLELRGLTLSPGERGGRVPGCRSAAPSWPQVGALPPGRPRTSLCRGSSPLAFTPLTGTSQKQGAQARDPESIQVGLLGKPPWPWPAEPSAPPRSAGSSRERGRDHSPTCSLNNCIYGAFQVCQASC